MSGSYYYNEKIECPEETIAGPRDSPVPVLVVNTTAEDDQPAGDESRIDRNSRGLHASPFGIRRDASTPDASWICAFCERATHHSGLGDLFGPYTVKTNCEEFRTLDETSQKHFPPAEDGMEVWFHEDCAVWAPELLAVGEKIFGLELAIWGSRAAKCSYCSSFGAAIACATSPCRARTHVPCAREYNWRFDNKTFKVYCPRHA